MKKGWWWLLGALLCQCLVGCGGPASKAELLQVEYTSEAGSLLPELRWFEQMVITRQEVRLERRGLAAESQVNAGSWSWAVDSSQTAALFEQLNALDCAALRRVEPEEAPDGGGTDSYTLVYAQDVRCTLTYNPGVTYEGGEQVLDALQDFVRSLALSPEVANRYRFPTP